jgi:hypothetical protein
MQHQPTPRQKRYMEHAVKLGSICLNEPLAGREDEKKVKREFDTYGPLCSIASQVKTYLRILKPHPRNRARCESASPPSDKSPSGRPTKLSPSPASTLSQKPSRTCEGWLRGVLDDPDRFTPRRMRTRPWLSTKWFAVVWTKWSGTGSPVAGDLRGIRGIRAGSGGAEGGVPEVVNAAGRERGGSREKWPDR